MCKARKRVAHGRSRLCHPGPAPTAESGRVVRSSGPKSPLHRRPRLRHGSHRRGYASAASRPPQACTRTVVKVGQSAQPPADRSVQPRFRRRGGLAVAARRLLLQAGVSAASVGPLHPRHDHHATPLLARQGIASRAVPHRVPTHLGWPPDRQGPICTVIGRKGPRCARPTGDRRVPGRACHCPSACAQPQTWCAVRHARPNRCHCGRLRAGRLLWCQAQRCSVTAQPGGSTLHPLFHDNQRLACLRSGRRTGQCGG